MLSLAEQTLCPFSVTCIFPITRTALISEAGEKSVHMSPTSIPSAADCIICADISRYGRCAASSCLPLVLSAARYPASSKTFAPLSFTEVYIPTPIPLFT